VDAVLMLFGVSALVGVWGLVVVLAPVGLLLVASRTGFCRRTP
jgi:hypothetical protein